MQEDFENYIRDFVENVYDFKKWCIVNNLDENDESRKKWHREKQINKLNIL